MLGFGLCGMESYKLKRERSGAAAFYEHATCRDFTISDCRQYGIRRFLSRLRARITTARAPAGHRPCFSTNRLTCSFVVMFDHIKHQQQQQDFEFHSRLARCSTTFCCPT